MVLPGTGCGWCLRRSALFALVYVPDTDPDGDRYQESVACRLAGDDREESSAAKNAGPAKERIARARGKARYSQIRFAPRKGNRRCPSFRAAVGQHFSFAHPAGGSATDDRSRSVYRMAYQYGGRRDLSQHRSISGQDPDASAHCEYYSSEDPG